MCGIFYTMNRRTYITRGELNKLLNYLKDNKLYRHYVIILCLTELSIKYKNLEQLTWDKAYLMFSDRPHIVEELKEIRDYMVNTHRSVSGHNRDKIVQMTLRGFNRVMKEHQRYIGLRHISDFSSKLFNTKIIVESEEVFGYIEHKRAKNIVVEKRDNYIYVLRHTHRDERINILLTDKKIGITNNPYNRKLSLTIGPVDVECLKLWKVEVSFVGRVEKLLHKKFKDRNVVGEWFEDNDNLLITEIEKEIMTLRLLDIDIEEVSSTKMSKSIIVENTI